MDLELATIEFLLQAQGEDKTREPFSFNVRYPVGEVLAQAQHISKFFGRFQALNNVSLQVHSGEILGLVGGNGAGKSTLIRLLLGLDLPERGKVELFGMAPSQRTRAQIGYVPQSLGLYPRLSARENLQFTTNVFHCENVPCKQVQDRKDTPVEELSLGQKRELAVLCALSHQPKLLILDEPTSGMDALGRVRLWKTLRRAANAGVGILITTHYQDEASQTDRLIELTAGQVSKTTTLT